MRGAWLLVLEIGALLLTVPVLFFLVMGTWLVPTEVLSAGRHYDDFCTPPGSVPWWLLGLAIALALLAVAVLLTGLAWWARARRRSGGGLSPAVVPALQSALCAGAAIIALWTLWIHIDEWAWYTEHCSDSEPTICPAASVTTYLAQALFGVIAVGAVAGAALFVRRAYRAYVRTHPGQPLSAKTVFGIAVALLIAAALGALFVSSFTLLRNLGYGYVQIPCDASALGHCLEPVPPTSGGVWIWAGIAQVAALAGMLGSLGFACAPLRERVPGRRVISGFGPRTVVATWAIGVVVTLMIDLDKYADQWIDWAHSVAWHADTPFVYPSREVRTGVIVTFTVALAAFVLAAVLLWRGHRRRTLGTSSAREA